MTKQSLDEIAEGNIEVVRNKILLLDRVYNPFVLNIHSPHIIYGKHDFELGGESYDFFYEVYNGKQNVDETSLLVPVLPYRSDIRFTKYVFDEFQRTPLLSTLALRVPSSIYDKKSRKKERGIEYALAFYDVRKKDSNVLVNHVKEYFLTSLARLQKQFGEEWEKKKSELNLI